MFAKGEDTVADAELGTIMRSMGLNPSEDDVKDMIAEVELNRDYNYTFNYIYNYIYIYFIIILQV